MDANWAGYEALRQDCIAAPKYGNDNDYVDWIAKDIVDYTEHKMNCYPSLYAYQWSAPRPMDARHMRLCPTA